METKNDRLKNSFKSSGGKLKQLGEDAIRGPEKPKKRRGGLVDIDQVDSLDTEIKGWGKYPVYKVPTRTRKTLPQGDVVLNDAPKPAEVQPVNWITVLATPVVMLVLCFVIPSIATMAIFSSIGVVTALFTYFSQKKKHKNDSLLYKDEYHKYLDAIDNYDCGLADCRMGLKDLVNEQYAIRTENDPSLEDCYKDIRELSDIWNRSPKIHSDFMALRVGTGTLPSTVHITAPRVQFMQDNELADEARDLAECRNHVDNVPIVFDFKSFETLGIIGARDAVVDETISIILHMASHHSYEDVRLVILYPQGEEERWKELRWLPHVFDGDRTERYMACTKEDAKSITKSLENMITSRIESSKDYNRPSSFEPFYLIIVADNTLVDRSFTDLLTRNGDIGISTIFIGESEYQLPSECKAIINIGKRESYLYESLSSDKKLMFTPDRIPDKSGRNFTVSDMCRAMAPVRVVSGAKQAIPRSVTFFEGYKVSAAEEFLDSIKINWAENDASKGLTTLVGLGKNRDEVRFNILKEGPHGLYAGTSGSGKTEVVRSWILSLALAFSPKELNFVLIDFKPPGLVNDLSLLPHVVGTFTPQEGAFGISRKIAMLRAEANRRMQVFSDLEVISIDEYRKLGATNPDIEPMPFLIVAFDEMAEGKSIIPSDDFKFVDKLFTIGRSLGMLTLVGSQTSMPFSEIMFNNANFRWQCRALDQHDSNQMVGTADAVHIPKGTPGRFFIKSPDSSVPREVQSLYSSASIPDLTKKDVHRKPKIVQLSGARQSFESKLESSLESQAEAVVRVLNGYAQEQAFKAPRMVLTDQLASEYYFEDVRNIDTSGHLRATVGMIDNIAAQRQYPMIIDFERELHIAIMSSPQKGKTTFLKSICMSLFTTYAPEKLNAYIIDAMSTKFIQYANFPQVKSVATDSVTIDAVVAELDKECRRRKRSLSDSDPSIVVFIDNVNYLVSSNRDFMKQMLQFGAGCRMYFVMTGTSNDFMHLDQWITSRYCLYISNRASDYKSAMQLPSDMTPPVPVNTPGRGICITDEVVTEFQVVLPTSRSGGMADENAYCERKIDEALINWKPVEGLVNKASLDFTVQNAIAIFGNDNSKRDKTLAELLKLVSEAYKCCKIAGLGLCEKNASSNDSIENFTEYSDIDTFVASLTPILQERNEQLAANPKAEFEKYVVVIDDVDNLVSGCSELTSKRILQNLIGQGKRFGVIVLLSCGSDSLIKIMNLSDDDLRKNILHLLVFTKKMLVTDSISRLADVFEGLKEELADTDDSKTYLLKDDQPVYYDSIEISEGGAE